MNHTIKIILNESGQPVVESASTFVAVDQDSLTSELYEEYGFAELETDLIDEFRGLMNSVKGGDLIDFCPDWLLESFMQERFSAEDNPESYKQCKKAMLFYHRLGCHWREEFAKEQDEFLSNKSLWGYTPEGNSASCKRG